MTRNDDLPTTDDTTRPDGGTEEAASTDEVVLDPWGSSDVDDYRRLFDNFGIEPFDDILAGVPDPHYLMRRGVIFGHREYNRVAEAMRDGKPFAALSGFMPTGDPHIGHKLVFDELIWHQERGGETYALIADLEAHSAREKSWEEIDKHAKDYILSLLALGYDPEAGELYRQSTNRTVQDLGFELGAKANFSELQAIYGFNGETDISHMQSVITQMADILYPQLDRPIPTVIPVGPDQDPHVRLARDLASRLRYFGVTSAYASFEADDDERELLAQAFESLSDGDNTVRCEEAADWLEEHVHESETRAGAIEKCRAAGKEPLRPRVRFLNRNATPDAFTGLIERIEGEKRVYDEHIDAFDLTHEEAAILARDVEVEFGGYGFLPPSSLYHRFMTGLTGGKMSSSIPASHISLLDDPSDGYEKVKSATTGGRETAELQRDLGGRADECPVYELYAYLLAGDDDDYATRVYQECVNGERLCGECKEEAAQQMSEFLEEHQQQREEAEARLKDLSYQVTSDR